MKHIQNGVLDQKNRKPLESCLFPDKKRLNMHPPPRCFICDSVLQVGHHPSKNSSTSVVTSIIHPRRTMNRHTKCCPKKVYTLEMKLNRICQRYLYTARRKRLYGPLAANVEFLDCCQGSLSSSLPLSMSSAPSVAPSSDS